MCVPRASVTPRAARAPSTSPARTVIVKPTACGMSRAAAPARRSGAGPSRPRRSLRWKRTRLPRRCQERQLLLDREEHGVKRRKRSPQLKELQRRRRDSNPWYRYRYGGFQNRCLRPLGHSSGSPASEAHRAGFCAELLAVATPFGRPHRAAFAVRGTARFNRNASRELP